MRSNTSFESSRIATLAELAGRILIVLLFLWSGLGKVMAYSATAGFMASMGVPTAVLPVVIATEVLGSVAILLGWRTRIVAFLLAGFTLLTGALFHHDFANQEQMINLMKNVSIAGAFLLLVAHGAGPISIDRRKGR